MGGVWTTYGAAFADGVMFVICVFVVGLWLASIALKDTSIADIFWGFGSAGMAWVFYFAAKGADPRATVTLVLATLWGVRLGAYIGWRNWGAEDARYARLRRHVTDQGKSYVWHSLRAVFGFQGVCMVLCTLPLLVAIIAPSPARLGPAAWLGGSMVCLGLAIESLADWQMARFRVTRASKGEVMDRGLWRYSRHPNYFGEMVVQWGFFMIAADVGLAGLLTIAAPLALSYLIVGPMGANLLERRLGKKNPAYADYVRRTSAFAPWPPKALAP